MAVGQAVLSGASDVPALTVVEERLGLRRVDTGRVHAGTLRDVLELHGLHLAAGMGLMTEASVA